MKKLYLDIETAPSIVFCWGLFDKFIPIDNIIEPGSSLQKDGEAAMVQKIHSLLEEADAVIHYNGKKFDIPKLNSEFLRLHYDPPATYHQIDLLETARRQFRLASNKLDYVCQHLEIGQKVKHSKGMELWKGCLNGDKKSWAIMEKYNKQDVRLLPKLYKRLLPWIISHPNEALYGDMNRTACPKCGSNDLQSRGFTMTRTQRYRRFQCMKCGSWSQSRFTTLSKEARDNILK